VLHVNNAIWFYRRELQLLNLPQQPKTKIALAHVFFMTCKRAYERQEHRFIIVIFREVVCINKIVVLEVFRATFHFHRDRRLSRPRETNDHDLVVLGNKLKKFIDA